MPRKSFLFAHSRRIEGIYRRELTNLFARIFALPKRAELSELVSRILSLNGQGELFERNAERIAERMVAGQDAQNARNWREAFRQSSNSQQIYKGLQKELQTPVGVVRARLIKQNAAYIKAIPADVARDVTAFVGREQLKGRRASDIAADLRQKMPAASAAKIDLIARTEVSKAATALTRARAENIGLKWYQWQTSEDARVRESHKRMDGVLVPWANPPSPEALIGEKDFGHYHAGNVFNCRCDTLPLVSVEDVQWPAKVYTGGAIERMSRKRFEALP